MICIFDKFATDFSGNGIGPLCPSSCEVSETLNGEYEEELEDDANTVDFVNINPVDALIGDSGVVHFYGGELARDWFDVYLIQRVGLDSGVQIREGKNLLGINYDVDDTDVITRIMPTGEDKDGELLYLPARQKHQITKVFKCFDIITEKLIKLCFC